MHPNIQAIHCMVLLVCRNPGSTKKRAITDSQLLTFVLLLVSLEMIVFVVYIGVEAAAPGYELEGVPNDDNPRGLVGVCCVRTYLLMMHAT